jgi:RHH-type rel operon transcriptional repressor/antitoxin RelB
MAIEGKIRHPQPGSIPPRATECAQPSLAITGAFRFSLFGQRGYNVYSVFMEVGMESLVLTLRVSAKTKSQLEKLAAATNGSKSFLASEALERYLELEAWQIKEIKLALKEAGAGEFASDKDLAKAIKKYGS